MGAGSGKELPYGVHINPRVEYANNRSKKNDKVMRIDAPALVQLKHGTVRYRYADGPDPNQKRIESTHEGLQLSKKKDYFYHHRFKHDEDLPPPDSWKYCYVYKGPEKAKQKRLYYVFGKGLKVNQNGFAETSYKPEEQSFQRPIFYKEHGHIYMDLIFLLQGGEVDEAPVSDEDNDEDDDADEDDVNAVRKFKDPLEPEVDDDLKDDETMKDIELTLDVKTQIHDIKARLAKKHLKPMAHIHLYNKGAELKSNQKLNGLTQVEKEQTKVNILLHPK